MFLMVLPLVLLFVIVLVPKIPKIGGEPRAALLIAGVAAAAVGGLSVTEFFSGTVSGIDKISWVIMLSIFGSIYAATQVRLGTIDATLSGLRSLFGTSSKALIAAIIVTLVFAGSLLGDAIAAATVIGFLVVRALNDLNLSREQITAIIVMGAVIGSGMPPISQSFILSSSLVGVDPDEVLPLAYPIMGVAAVIAIATGFVFARNKRPSVDLVSVDPAGGISQRSVDPAGGISQRRWPSFIPLLLLISIVIASTVFEYSIFEEWSVFSSVTTALSDIPIVQGITFGVVMAIIVTTLLSMAFLVIRRNARGVLKEGLTKVNKTVQIQLCAGFMIGMFYASGLIDSIKEFTVGLAPEALKLGGGFGQILVGAMTGSQTTAQATVGTFFGPSLTNIGVDEVNAAIGSALLAMGGQSMPPVGLTTFVVAGIVGAALGVKVNPVKAMLLILPVTLYMAFAGFVALFV